MKTAEKAKHTPGPWKIGKIGMAFIRIETEWTRKIKQIPITLSGKAGDEQVVEEPLLVANVHKILEGISNARLIALAPEMFELLKDVRECLHESDQERIDALLAKADPKEKEDERVVPAFGGYSK